MRLEPSFSSASASASEPSTDLESKSLSKLQIKLSKASDSYADDSYAGGSSYADDASFSDGEDDFAHSSSVATSQLPKQNNVLQSLWRSLIAPAPSNASMGTGKTRATGRTGSNMPIDASMDENHLSESASVISEEREETLTEKIRESMPKCGPSALPKCGPDDILCDSGRAGRTNDLHNMINKQKWQAIRRRLVMMSELDNDKHSPSELRQAGKMELMIKEIDEHGRTPLSLACGKTSAPYDIIAALVKASPFCASVQDRNDNLPIHHFCHSYKLSKYEVLQDEWDVLQLLHDTNPLGIQSSNAYGNTPLHIYLEHRCGDGMRAGSLDLVLQLIEMFPRAVSLPNRGGSLPMHHIGKKTSQHMGETMGRGTEMEDIRTVVSVMHKANPAALRTPNNLGATPFFVAVIYNADMEIWKALLNKYPQASAIDNGKGLKPIAAYWNMFVSLKAKTKYLNLSERDALQEEEQIERHRKAMSKIRSLQHMRLKAPPELIEFWSKMELMLRAASTGTISQRLPKNMKWRVLHAICATKDCPADALKFALQMYSFQADEPDEEGNLPLHVVANVGGKYVTKREEENLLAMVRRLLSVNPYAAGEFNGKGRLPLHIALSTGYTWESGISAFIEANPSSTQIRDPVTGLYPFMLASVKERHSSRREKRVSRPEMNSLSLTCVFELLRAAPDMVFPNVDFDESKDTKMQKKTYELLRAKAKLSKNCQDMEQKSTKLRADLEKKDATVAKLQKELDEMKMKMTTAEQEHGKSLMKLLKKSMDSRDDAEPMGSIEESREENEWAREKVETSPFTNEKGLSEVLENFDLINPSYSKSSKASETVSVATSKKSLKSMGNKIRKMKKQQI